MWEQMMGMLAMFKEMRSVFGSFGGEAPSGDGDSFSPVIAEVIKGLVTKQQSSAPTRGALQPPRPAIPRQNPVSASKRSIIDELSAMDPTDASKIVIQALGNMPESKRERAIQEFLTSMNDEIDIDDLDDSSISDDNYDDDATTSPELQPPPGATPNRRNRN
jgi:hypothetical protein